MVKFVIISWEAARSKVRDIAARGAGWADNKALGSLVWDFIFTWRFSHRSSLLSAHLYIAYTRCMASSGSSCTHDKGFPCGGDGPRASPAHFSGIFLYAAARLAVSVHNLPVLPSSSGNRDRYFFKLQGCPSNQCGHMCTLERKSGTKLYLS